MLVCYWRGVSWVSPTNWDKSEGKIRWGPSCSMGTDNCWLLLNRTICSWGLQLFPVICSQVIYDKYSGRSRRFAFVTMKTVEDANAAVEKLNGTVSLNCMVILAAFQYFWSSSSDRLLNSTSFFITANRRSWNQSKRDRKTFDITGFAKSPDGRISIHWQPPQSLCWQSCKNSNNRDAQKFLCWEGEGSQCKANSSSRYLEIQRVWVCIIFIGRGCRSCYLILK